MSLLVARVLFPALLIDVLTTTALFGKNRRFDKWEVTFVPSFLYFISAIARCIFYARAPQWLSFRAVKRFTQS